MSRARFAPYVCYAFLLFLARPTLALQGDQVDTLKHGAAFTLIGGGALVLGDGAGGGYKAIRVAAQLSGIGSGQRAIETAADAYMLLIPEGGLVFGVSGGPNLLRPGGTYFGPVAGVLFGGAGPLLDLGIRAGIRPHRAGARPEARADLYFERDDLVAVIGFSIGLQFR